MVELAGRFGYHQPNAALTDPGHNAWDPDVWAGGSSSASAQAVAAVAVPFAIGSESWESITVPARFNGMSGFRSTYGRVSRRGAMARSWTMDKFGPIARTVDDCTSVLAAIVGPDATDLSTLARPAFSPKDADFAGTFHFGVLRHATPGAESEVVANFAASLAVLAESGALSEVDLPDLPFDAAAAVIVHAEGALAFESSSRRAGRTD